MGHNWREGRQAQERGIKETLIRQGCDDEKSRDFARRRANKAAETAVNKAIEEGTSRPPEI